MNDAPQVGTDSAGNVYVVATGAAALQAFTSAGLGPAATSAGGEDVYLARFSASGTAVWITHIGSAADDNLGFLAVDSGGNPVVVSTVLHYPCLLGQVQDGCACSSRLWPVPWQASSATAVCCVQIGKHIDGCTMRGAVVIQLCCHPCAHSHVKAIVGGMRFYLYCIQIPYMIHL